MCRIYCYFFTATPNRYGGVVFLGGIFPQGELGSMGHPLPEYVPGVAKKSCRIHRVTGFKERPTRRGDEDKAKNSALVRGSK